MQYDIGPRKAACAITIDKYADSYYEQLHNGTEAHSSLRLQNIFKALADIQSLLRQFQHRKKTKNILKIKKKKGKKNVSKCLYLHCIKECIVII